MAKVKKTEIEQEKEELKNRLARALADYDNLVKRQVRERDEIYLRATRNFVEDLFQVLDGLERAEEYLQDPGLKMAMLQLRQTLLKQGLVEIAPRSGDKFDANLHEVIDTIGGGDLGIIARLLTKGYKWMYGKVLRPAKVQVYNGDHKAQSGSGEKIIQKIMEDKNNE